MARPDEIDRVSTAGYALGYLGGGLLLALNVAWILAPATFGLRDAGQASRLSFLSVAVWWAVFSDAAVQAGARAECARAQRGPSTLELIRASFSDCFRHSATSAVTSTRFCC